MNISSIVLLLVSVEIVICCTIGKNNVTDVSLGNRNYCNSNVVVDKAEINDNVDNCSLSVDQRSIDFFRSRLDIADPNFMRFKVIFGKYHPKHTSDTFHPFQWVWTYKSKRGLYPYLQWNVDYDVLSFGLLDVKTFSSGSFILINVSGNCNLTLGERQTTELIAEQLTVLVSKLSPDSETITRYQDSFWCYQAEAPGFRDTLAYHLGLYLLYPTSGINYNCCNTNYDFMESKYSYSCMDRQMPKWKLCTTGPYIIGMVLFLFSPIVLFQIADYLSPTERDGQYTKMTLHSSTQSNIQRLVPNMNDHCDWLCLDGKFPKSFTGLLASLFPKHYPIALSRLKRFLFVLLGPVIVFIQLIMYYYGMASTTEAYVSRGIPVGFLSFFGKTSQERRNAFAPALGGPDVILTSYYVLGVLFLVFPRSVQDVIENGIPKSTSDISPLWLSAEECKRLSHINVSDGAGYKNAANLFLCRFYMLFTDCFWKRIYRVQKARIYTFCVNSSFCKCILIFFLPLYVLLCLLEIVISIVYFSIPLCSFMVVIVHGAVRTIAITIRSHSFFTNIRILSILMKNRIVVITFSIIIAVLFTFFVYSFCLVFIQSFFFISQLLVYCYVAVIVYPEVAFGYLFFGVVFLYYIVRVIAGFGAKYLALLNDTIEIVIRIEEQDNYLAWFDGHLLVSNIKICTFNNININGTNVRVSNEK